MSTKLNELNEGILSADVIHAVWPDETNPTGHGMLVVRGVEHLIQLEDQEAATLSCAVVRVPDFSAAIRWAMESGRSTPSKE